MKHTLESLTAAVKAGKLKLHHTSYYRGYVSRKGDGEVYSYSGRFGTGYTHLYNDGTSSWYSRVAYYIHIK